MLGPPCKARLAVHRRKEKVVIRLVEALRSPDNPTEIAHGFSVPQVENKNTPLEYSMKFWTHPDPGQYPTGLSSRQLYVNNTISIISPSKLPGYKFNFRVLQQSVWNICTLTGCADQYKCILHLMFLSVRTTCRYNPARFNFQSVQIGCFLFRGQKQFSTCTHAHTHTRDDTNGDMLLLGDFIKITGKNPQLFTHTYKIYVHKHIKFSSFSSAYMAAKRTR